MRSTILHGLCTAIVLLREVKCGAPGEPCQDYAGAVEDFTCAIRLEPGNADFYHNRGFALRKMVRGLGLPMTCSPLARRRVTAGPAA